ncbi:MAG: hypothetical protein M3Z64_10045 [Verrucomicrobiota bacterium]|nr:hypothetical protein [Verrucomicrobiota bacterium]
MTSATRYARVLAIAFTGTVAIAQESPSEIQPTPAPTAAAEVPPHLTAAVSAANPADAEAEADRAANLERHGKKEAAIEHYELAARSAEELIAEMNRTNVPQADRSLDIYYRCATSYLHAGRLLAFLKREDERKDEDLQKAALYLDQIEKIESERAQRSGGRLNPEVWRVRNAAGYASFLQGQLAEARLHYRAVLEINPSYKPAEQAIAAINKIEQEQNEMFTPQGPTLQKEKKRRLFQRIIDTLKLVKSIVPIPL